MSSSTNNTTNEEIIDGIPGWIHVFKDGTIERPMDTPIVPPPSLDDTHSKLSAKDVVISQDPPVSARIFLPNINNNQSNDEKLPIYVYFHGGGFFFESTFSEIFTTHFLKVVPLAKAITVSVEYRRVPENPLPACYEDCWTALQWIASHSSSSSINTNGSFTNQEEWLIKHGDFNRLFIGGDSAGANTAHNLAMRAGTEPLNGGVKIRGAILIHPYFFGTYPVGAESVEGHASNYFCRKVWELGYPCCPGGLDNPLINPLLPSAPSLAGLACSKMIVIVAGKDRLGLRERGFTYYEAVKNSGWQGTIEFYEDKEEDHVYHMFNPEHETAEKMFKRIASFIQE